MQHIAVVQALYAAFARGDIDTILDNMAPDVAWEPGMADHGVPWLVQGSGTDHVRRFFHTLAGHVDVGNFEPVAFLTGDGQVAAVIEFEAVVRSTGGAIRDREVHLWTFDDAGKITALRHFLDTHQHVAAARGEAPAPH